MSKKLSKAFRHEYGVASPSKAEIKELEDSCGEPIDLDALIAKSKADANVRLKRPKNGPPR